MKMLIGGHLVDAENNVTVPLYNPATMEEIDRVPCASAGDVEKAICAAQEGFFEWSEYTLGKRVDILRNFEKLYVEHSEELAQLTMKEIGRPITQSRFFIEEALEGIDSYIEQARFLKGDVLPEGNRPVRKGDLIVTTREPLGIVVCIIPFNYPITMTTMKVIPALVMGNSVIVKPATDTPLAVALFCRLLIEAGVPANAVQMVTGRGSEIGQLLTGDPRIAKVSLTGSTVSGITVAKSCAPNLTRMSLELGGNDAFIVLADSRLDDAVQEAYQCRIQNSGQTCISPKRLLVQESVKDAFIQKLLSLIEETVVGDPALEETQMGPVVSREAAIRVKEQIDHTIEQGGKLLYGGNRYQECYIEPTVIEADRDMDIAKDMEVFGPVFTIISFNDLDEAISIANQSQYGLNGGVYGNNIQDVMYIAKRIQCGSMVINGSGCMLSKDQPFGGWKMSGNGCREGGTYVLEEMSQIKTLFFRDLY